MNRSGRVLIVLLVMVAVWTPSILAWRWTLRRLHLSGDEASNTSEQERRVRRGLRALLAFDFLVGWPLTIPVAVLALVGGVGELALVTLTAAAIFTLPLLGLVPSARRLREARLRHGPIDEPPSLLVDAEAFFARERTPLARWGIRLALAGGLLTAWYVGRPAVREELHPGLWALGIGFFALVERFGRSGGSKAPPSAGTPSTPRGPEGPAR